MNTHKDSPSRGLSQLQKKIIGWLLDPGVEYQNAPIGSANTKHRPDFGVSAPSLHRAAKRLEERQLLVREKFYGVPERKWFPNYWWRLTDAGLETAKRLSICV